MASRNYAPDHSLMRGVTRIQGVLTGTGASAPTITAALGVTSVARTALGRYLITFNGRFRRLLDFRANVMPGVTGTNAGTVALARVANAMQPFQTTVNGVPVTQIEVYVTNNTGAEALTELAVGDLLTFEATFQNSSARPSVGD